MKSYDKVKTEEKKGGTVVVPSKLVSLNVKGGVIEGIFQTTQKRQSDGNEYIVHIIEGKGIGLDKATKKPIALEEGRYGVFGVTRLDPLMRELQKGDKVRLTYLGMEKNDKSEKNPSGEGEHHTYEVLVMD